MNILVLNSGSSSLKFQLIDTDPDKTASDTDRRLARGIIERIGSQALLKFENAAGSVLRSAQPIRDHRGAIDVAIRWLVSPEAGIPEVSSLADIHAIGHRVVHGGERFTASSLLTREVIDGIEECIDLAPLHNPENLKGIRAATEIFGPGIPQAAVFDTAFHHSMPEHSYLYAIPYQFYRRHRLRRYGFHGTSHRYMAYRYRKMLELEKRDVNIITIHLGNGCSATAIREGFSIDTSMGLTPLEGLVMGTRSGDIDPAVIEYLMAKEGFSIDQIDTMLNKQSGLLGISGLTNDMRELLAEEEENGDRRARLAIDIFVARIRKYVGAYLAEMNGATAIVFAGGIGENSPRIRARICAHMDWFGLRLDPDRNERLLGGIEGEISTVDSRLRAYVIPTDEELLIARDTMRLVHKIEVPAW
ncbi:MAG TPA: acetate kinase [Candidatus Kapabacteria bacterium]|nr:acetate kinase [Candidatus Kapabacteria bacterium]